MEKSLISITDENTILITTRFIYNSKKKKTTDNISSYYDLDLIVKKDITCDQLMEAIFWGLLKKVIDHPLVFNVIDYYINESRNTKGNNVIDFSELEPCIPSTETEIFLKCWQIYYLCYNFYKSDINYSITKQNDIGRARTTLGSLNFRKIPENLKISVAHETQIFLNKNRVGNIKICDLGFMTSTRLQFDVTGHYPGAALFQDELISKGYQNTIPLYNISERPLLKLDDTEVNIISPTDPPEKGNVDIIGTLLSSLLMMGAMTAARMFTSSGFGITSLAMYAAMGIASIGLGFYNWKRNENLYEKKVTEWKTHYELYITSLINDIHNKQVWDINQLKDMYPSKSSGKNSLITKANAVSADIFSRNKEHPDFLKVRLGISGADSHLVPSVFNIVGAKRDVVFSSVRYKNIDIDDKLKIDLSTHPFEILMNDNDPDSKNRYLTDLPHDISLKYAHLKGAPVLLPLKECEALGIVFPEKMDFYPFIDNIIFDLCFYHSADDLQLVMLCPPEKDWTKRQSVISKYKHLPHFRELLGDISPFAFDQTAANKIFNKLLEVLSERAKDKNNDTTFPHIVLIILDEYDFKRHPVAEYLPEYKEKAEEKKDFNISYIFCKRYNEELPKYCGGVIKAKADREMYLFSHIQKLNRPADYATQDTNEFLPEYQFVADEFLPRYGDYDNQKILSEYLRAFKILSALYYLRIAQGAGVKEYLDLFEVHGYQDSFNISMDSINISDEQLSALSNLIPSEQEEKINELKLKEYKKMRLASLKNDLSTHVLSEWSSSDVKDITKSLAVPIGQKAGGEVVYLDLHEKGDGPHMLVAGTTGSGKTETILTYLIGLCTLYTPEQVNLLLMDMKGAGFVSRIGNLKHVVGKVTDVDGDENGTSMEYMLKRFLYSMSAEVKRRKRRLNDMGVDSIDGYIKAQNKLMDHVINLAKKSTDKNFDINKKYEELSALPKLAHLFLVIDEFTELMRFSSDNSDIDFKSEITSLARIGRSLGFHIILISQNIEGAITDDIRVNAKARLCLKVATREASREMIGTDIAYGPLMPGNGRAYLWIDGGSRFEYFQSGFSGADSFRNSQQPVSITYAEMNGEYSSFYPSKEEKERLHKKLDEKLTMLQNNNDNFESGFIPFCEDNKSSSNVITSDISQIDLLGSVIIDTTNDLFAQKKLQKPKNVFQSPLPQACYFEFAWDEKKPTKGELIELKPTNKEVQQ